MMNNIIQPGAPSASPGAFPDRSIRLNFSIQPLAFSLLFQPLAFFFRSATYQNRVSTRNNAK
jgi:hypothetical protein